MFAIYLNAKVSSHHRPILKRLERFERLEPVGLTGADAENKFFMDNLDQRAEGNQKLTVSD